MPSGFADPRRSEELAEDLPSCRHHRGWGGGETPDAGADVDPNTDVLAGSAIGQIRPKALRVNGEVRDGDAMVVLASSGFIPMD